MIILKGGDGASPNNAIEIIGAKNSVEGISSEYKHLNQRFGQKDINWEFESQSLLRENNKFYDKITIKLLKENNKIVNIFFDITDFFLKTT